MVREPAPATRPPVAPLSIVVVGLGRAGLARVRELRARPLSFAIRGAVTRRPEAAAALGLPRWTFEAALAAPEVGAVAICDENARHEREVAAALGAGKEVLVEYPLALSAAGGRALFAAADAAGLRLHEGHVELCSDPHQALAAALRERGPAAAVELSFTGRADERMATVDEAGFPSFSGFARLNRLVDLWGPLRVQVATFARHREAGGESFVLQAELQAASGLPIRWREARGPPLHPSTECTVRYADGSELRGYGAQPPGPVFSRDTERFAELLAGRVDPAPERGRILHCLALAEELRLRALSGA